MDSKSRALARKVVSETINQMTEAEREEVQRWVTRSLTVVENKDLTKTEKLAELRRIKPTKAVLRILIALARVVKSKAWDNQSWARRLGLGGLAAGAVTFGTQGAGIAAFGTAVGVPLALLTGAGAALLGVVVDELKKK